MGMDMAIKRKREALVYQHLERVSRNLLVNHSDVVRKFIGRNSGIYALYHNYILDKSGFGP